MLCKTKFLLLTVLFGIALPLQAGFLGISPYDRQEFVQARETFRAGNYQQAVQELSDYIYKTKNIKRREARAYRLLGLSYEKLNKPEKALETYLEALEFHQKDIPLLLVAADLYQRSELTDRSIELYNRVLEIDPDNTEALSGQGQNYIVIGFYSQARKFYDHLFSLQPQTPAVHRARYAYAFLRQRDYEKAFINAVMALTEEPENANYWLIAAYACKGLNRMEEALANLDTAILLDPQRNELRALKAMWLYKQNQRELSLQLARKLLKENPYNELALFALYMNLKQSHPKQAKQALQKIKNLNSGSFAERVAEKLLM